MENSVITLANQNIEILTRVPDAAKEIAVLCHPHPLYGGNMHDGVLSMLDDALADIGTIRFNFRGVGNSSGEHGKGLEEAQDLIRVVGWVREQYDQPLTLVGGYSFGAMVVLSVLDQLNVAQGILVAPPVLMMKDAVKPTTSTLVILGEQDDIVEVAQTAEFFSDASVRRISDTDHFFVGKQTEIRRAIDGFRSGINETGT